MSDSLMRRQQSHQRIWEAGAKTLDFTFDGIAFTLGEKKISTKDRETRPTHPFSHLGLILKDDHIWADHLWDPIKGFCTFSPRGSIDLDEYTQKELPFTMLPKEIIKELQNSQVHEVGGARACLDEAKDAAVGT